MNIPKFDDRHSAGKALAKLLAAFSFRDNVIVLALPRGGVPVAYEVATALHLPLDVFVVRKLGAPGREEYAIGSIASGGVRILDDPSVRLFGISEAVLDQIIAHEEVELKRRELLYRGNRPKPELTGKTVIVVDDGLATGATMKAAVISIKRMGAKHVVVAAPVCAPTSCDELEQVSDVRCVCVYAPEPFYAVGLWYNNFDQVTDEEVQTSLAKADAGSVSAKHYI